MTNPLIARLRRLTSLTEGDLDALSQACTVPRHVKTRADISPQGDRPSSVDVLVEGWAARYKVLADGRRQIPALLLAGDICNLDGLLLNHVHPGVCALTDCQVISLPHVRLWNLFDRSPMIRDTFWWLQSVENAVQTEWSVGLGRRSATGKMAHLLCELFVRLGTVSLSSEKGFDFPLTQGDIADAIGVTTVHVNRTLMELRERGMVKLWHRRLTILDLDALKATSGFDSDYLHLEGMRRTRESKRRTADDRAITAER